MTRSATVLLLALLATIVAVSLFLRVHLVRTVCGGALLWNTEDAYFFVSLADWGYRPTYAGFVGDVAIQLLPFGVPTPDEKHESLLVLHVTPSGVQHYLLDNFWIGSGPYPFRGVLYLGYHDGKLMKWSGSRLEPATPEEAEQYHKYINNLTGPAVGASYDHVEGWSSRALAGEVVSESPTTYVEKDSKVTIEVDGKQLTFLMNSDPISREAHIDLINGDQSPQRIWQLDGGVHWVSAAEYKRIFAHQLAQEAVRGTISPQP
jgi:hypothetical protein